MKKVTLAMPVYNVERTVRAALLSALEQTYENIEFLVIDDGTPDRSMDVVAQLLGEHRRGSDARVIRHPQNLGLGDTRNTAIRHATGDYIYFMDSDDLLTPQCIESLVDYMEQTPVDFVAASRRRETFDGKLIAEDVYEPTLVSDGDMAVARYRYAGSHSILGEVWNKLYRLDFLRRARVECIPGCHVEDVSFSYQVILAARSCRLVPDVTYIYHIYEGQSFAAFSSNRPRALYLADCFCRIRERDMALLELTPRGTLYNAVLTGIFTTSYLHAQMVFQSTMLTAGEKRRYLSTLLDNGASHYDLLHIRAAKQLVMLALAYTPWWLRKLLFKRTTNYKGDYCAKE